ncbi:chemotaxis protein CheW [Ideonella livida]|uniref:Chemotaxis protein CheW n=1 Tax=Ideonella livida TaxID=2707176 RepID=A0A7C9TME8_9BURK|nr:chemotaxis protein CheW [Ideonella livida]NDY93262.1 chemotaxis protein CheW [Ideonella livida]
MPNKDALRELQLRLASRLQAARERPRDAGWLAVECGSAGLLLPLGQAGEIQAARDLTPVPHATRWLVGVANVRGQLNAVLDLSVFLGLRTASATAVRGGAQLVVMNASLRTNCALLVDRLAGLRDAEQLQPVPLSDPRPAFAPARWQDASGRQWDELDLAALIADPVFLDVAA